MQRQDHKLRDDALSSLATGSAVPSPSPASYREPWKLNALVLDDEVSDREWIATQLTGLEEYDVAVTKAGKISEALALLRDNCFDIALVDYRLPDGFGDTVIMALGERTPQCATVLISSHPMAEVSLYGIRAGATAALSKDDLNPALLETTIRFALMNQARRRVS